MGGKQEKQVILSCTHVRVYTTPFPAIGDSINCTTCRAERQVTGYGDQWRIRCQTAGCRTSRSYGSDEDEAMRGVHRHLLKNAAHVVNVLKNGSLYETVRDTGDSLPMRVTIVQEHQAQIKNLIDKYYPTKGL